MYLTFFITTVLLIAADVFSKLAAVRFLKDIDTFPIINNVFHLTFCRNTGAAFSLLSGNTGILALISVLMIAVIIAYIIVKKPTSRLLLSALSLIVAGGTGNIIDRVLRGYVIDFFDFRLINFAIFNVADVFVCVGVVLLAVYIIKTDLKKEESL